MSLIQIQNKFNTQKKCIEYLEKLRWNNHPVCSHCGATESITPRKNSNIYHCNYCNRDFTVLIGTIFEHSRLPLSKWFLMVSLMMDAKQGISAMQLSRNLDITYTSAWYTAMRVRCAMIEDIEISGTIEADETYIGGKPRKQYKKDESITSLSQVSENPDKLEISNNKRGRGTSKAKVAGIVERKGDVVIKLMDTFNTVTLLTLLKRNADLSETKKLVTDDATFYKKFDEVVNRLVIKHKDAMVRGEAHTNTIDGFWGLVKNSIRGQYRVLSKKYLPFYLSEFAYRYNRRNKPKTAFTEFLYMALHESRCMKYTKPIKPPKQIVYKYTDAQKELVAKNNKFIKKRKHYEKQQQPTAKRKNKKIRSKFKRNK